MEIHRENLDGGIIALRLEGRFDQLASISAEDRFLEAAAVPAPRVLVDLHGVDYISSGGLRVLLLLARKVEDGGGALALCGLTPFVSEVFDVSNLHQIFDVHPTRPRAQESLLKPAAE